MNCKNCGAPYGKNKDVCRYCGTEKPFVPIPVAIDTNYNFMTIATGGNYLDIREEAPIAPEFRWVTK